MATDIISVPPPPDWPRRLAAATFVLLFVFGLVLLVFPDVANELDERSGGGRNLPLEAVTITESKRTTEQQTDSTEDSSTQATNKRVPSGVGNSNGGAGSQNPRASERDSTTTNSGSSQTTGDVQTTTTETVRPTRDDGFAARALAVPAVFVLVRTAVVALISGLVAALVYRLGRKPSPRNNPGKPRHPDESSKPPPASVSAESPVQLPTVELVTSQKASAAKAEVIEGIPLLKEIFEARGEPVIENTLPDMRVLIQLTDEFTKEQPLSVSLLVEDPAVSLAVFYTELEQRLRRLSRDATAQTSPSVDSILRQLVEEGLFEPRAAEGFRDLLRLTERALHGSTVDPAIAVWVRTEGVALLMSLDLMLPS